MKFSIQIMGVKTIEIEGDDLKHALQNAIANYASLNRASLNYASLPAPTMMLLANWGTVSDALTRLCMRFDAANHPDPEAFTRWANDEECPYNNVKFQRCVNFQERRELWTPDLLDSPIPSAYELMVALIREKCADSDYHDKTGA